jgi:hypothetical protein
VRLRRRACNSPWPDAPTATSRGPEPADRPAHRGLGAPVEESNYRERVAETRPSILASAAAAVGASITGSSASASPTVQASARARALNALHLELSFHAQRSGAVQVGAGDLAGRLDGRIVVSFQVDGTDSFLSSTDGEAIEVAADAARTYGRPLVGIISAHGTDVHEGLAGLHAWGRGARAIAKCSGVVPVPRCYSVWLIWS